MTDLLDRLRAAGGPDRRLDIEIACFVSGLSVEHFNEAISDGGDWSEEEWPRYTASLDSAMTLVPEGMEWVVTSNGAKASMWDKNNHDIHEIRNSGEVATPALALCIAALLARSSPMAAA